MEEISREAQKTGTALEVNASVRMDLKDADIRKAVEAGVKLAIDSDAHDKSHFRFLRFGIAQARRGWAKASDVMNTRDVVGFLGLLKKK